MSANGKRLGYLLLLAVLVWVGFEMWPGEVGTEMIGGDGSPAVEVIEQTGSADVPPEGEADPDSRIPLSLDEGVDSDASFLGSVLNPDGDPIAGATVKFYGRGKREPENLLVEVRTTSDGKFRASPGSDWPQSPQLVARADGYSGISTGAVRGEERVITLQWLAPVFGRVIDKESGRGVVGARVAIGRNSAQTGPEGEYRLEGVRTASRNRVKVEKDGFAEKTVEFMMHRPEGQKLDIAIESGVELTVRVYDAATEAPLPGVQVIDRMLMRYLTSGSPGKPRTITDENGQFTIRVMQGTRLELTLLADGYSPFTWYWDVSFTRDLAPRVPMHAEAWIEGGVHDANGNPVSGAQIQANNKDRPMGMWRIDSQEAEGLDLPGYPAYHDSFRSPEEGLATNDDGLFRVAVYAKSKGHHVVATHQDYVSSDPVRVEGLSPARPVWVDLTLVPGATIRGEVMFNGKPWTGRLNWQLGEAGGGRRGAREGRYEFKNVPSGTVTLQARDRRSDKILHESKLEVEAGKVYEHDVTWEEEFETISGQVRSTSGLPIAEAQVNASGQVEGRKPSYYAKTDANGKYILEVRPGMSYAVQVMRADRPPAIPDVAPGSTDIDFALPDLTELFIRLIDAESKKPILIKDRRPTWIFWKKSGSTAHIYARATLDSRGYPKFKVALGSIDLMIDLRKDGYAVKEFKNIQSNSYSENLPLTLELRQGHDLAVQLLGDGERAEIDPTNVLFLLEESRVGAIGPPDPSRGRSANMTVNRIGVWSQNPSRTEYMVHSGEVLLRGLKAGTYVFVPVPDDLDIEPRSITVPAKESPVVVRWRKH